MMSHDYVIHSAHKTFIGREFEVDGQVIQGRIPVTIYELVDPDGGPTLTLNIPTRNNENLGQPGDTVTVTATSRAQVAEKVEEPE